MDELEKSMRKCLANTFVMYFKTHGFHWNVEGASFPQLHALFEKIYDDIYDGIDTFAEQLRALQLYTPASLQKFSMLTQVEDEDDVPAERDMVAELLADSEKMANLFKITYEMAEKMGDHGLANFLAERQDIHKKYSWQLRATLK